LFVYEEEEEEEEVRYKPWKRNWNCHHHL